MFCKNCGRQLDEGETLCPACGTMNNAETPAAATVSYDLNATETVNEHLKDEMAGEALKWGIISLAFAASGCLSLLGFIFSFIAKGKALAYQNVFGVLEGRAKAGRILSKIGFGVGLGYSIFFAIYFVAIVALTMSEMGAL